MFPVYKYLDSYPQPTHQRNHPPQYPHLYPGWESVPPYAKLESPIPPVNYEPWPYPNSTECHGCCSHGYPSGFYNYRPPHSHLPPHPPLYFHGAYPPYPDSHPTYFIPPSPYSTGQPQYEYDKNIPSYHFCGCSNHSRFPKSESSVKIEEQKPEIENKKDDSSGPINFLNYPYPVVWFPPGYTKDRESSVKIEEHKPEKDNKKDDSSSSINFPSYPYPAVWFPPGFKNGEVNKQTEAEPKFQNGWVPLEMHGNRLPKNGGEEKKNQQNGEEKKTQFPLPIIWMPGYDRPEEAQKNDLKEIDVDSGAAKDPPKLKIIPLKLLEKDNHEDKQGEVTVPGNEEKVEAAAPQNKENLVVAEKERKIRSIPVKQIEEIEKRTDENGTKKPSSPVKTSKLPPVCLRVDPMPGKKTKVSKSRSPSPPGEERSLRQAHVVDSKLPKHAAEDGEGLGKRDTKVVEVDKKTTNTGKEDKEDESAAKVLVQVPVGSTKDVSEKTVEERENQISVIPSKDISGKTATEEEDKGVTAKEDHGVAEATKGQGEEVKKKSFTIEEAAVLIQSAYHGFEVRRFEPLKKLKQIARVRDQVHDIRERICSLEASAEHRKDEKQILVISEAIMGLLLQLDTIQGLHPSVREVRKAVARELVCLQEKLDSLSGLPEEETKSTVVEVLTDNSAEDGNQTARDCSSVPEGLGHKTEELAETPLVRDGKLDSNVEVFAELPMLGDGKSHSSSEESAELSVMNVETSAPKMEEPVSSLVKVEVPLLEDGKTESELEELSLPSLVKIESEFEPMEEVDQDSKLDDFLHPTMVKDGIVEKPKSQPGESVEAKSKAEESMVELANSLVKDEQPKSKMVDCIELTLLEDENAEPNFVELSPPSSVKAETEFEPVEEVETEPKSDELLQTLKDEILEETESQPEEFGEPKSKQEESMEPASEPKQPSLGRGENSGEPEPKLEESEMGGETIPGSLISVAVGEKIETGSNTESLNAIVGGEETETKETEETEPGKSATDGFMEEIESVSTKAANEPNVLENVSTQSILENGSTESKFVTEFTAQTHEEILRPLVEATENAENRPLIEVESTLVDGEAVSEITRENRGIDLEVAEELGSTEAIEEGDLECKKKWAGKLEEQNEKLREMVEMLLEAGKKQLNVITDLGDRVRDLEKKLSKKKQKGRRQKMKGRSCSRVGNNLVRESSGSTALC